MPLSYIAITEAFLARHLGCAFEPVDSDVEGSSHEIRVGDLRTIECSALSISRSRSRVASMTESVACSCAPRNFYEPATEAIATSLLRLTIAFFQKETARQFTFAP
jgi:hypothetical protein